MTNKELLKEYICINNKYTMKYTDMEVISYKETEYLLNLEDNKIEHIIERLYYNLNTYDDIWIDDYQICPYCILNKSNCSECYYGIINKECAKYVTSKYRKILKKLNSYELLCISEIPDLLYELRTLILNKTEAN
jgi:hypothetical protein